MSGPQALRTAQLFRREHEAEVPVRVAAVDHTSTSKDQLIRENVMLRDDNEFLKTYITRCEGEMRLYQAQLPNFEMSLGGAGILAMDEELPPWIANSKYISPLLLAYENRITELQHLNDDRGEEVRTLKGECEALLARNNQVETELEGSYAKLLHQLDDSANQPDAGVVVESEELRERLAIYKEEAEILHTQEEELRSKLHIKEVETQEKNVEIADLEGRLEQLRANYALLKTEATGTIHDSQREIESLRTQLQMQKDSFVAKLTAQSEAATHHAEGEKRELRDEHENQINELNNKIAQLTDQLEAAQRLQDNQTMTSAREHERVSNELARIKSHASKAVTENANLKAQQSQKDKQAANEIKSLEERLDVMTLHEKRENDKNKEVIKKVEELESRLFMCMQELDGSQSDCEGMKRSMEMMDRTLVVYKERELTIARRESDAAVAVEEAHLQRDQTIEREKQLCLDIERLRERMTQEAIRAKQVSADDISRVYQRCKDKEYGIMEQMKSLELTCADLEGARERAVREYKSIQFQLDSIKNSASDKHNTFLQEITELKQELLNVERVRDEIRERHEKSVKEMHRLQLNWGKEKTRLTSQLDSTQQKLEETKRNHEEERARANEATSNVSKLQESVAEHGRKIEQIEMHSKQRLDSLLAQHSRDLSAVEERLSEAYDSNEGLEVRERELILERDNLQGQLHAQRASADERTNRAVQQLQGEGTSLNRRCKMLEARVQTLIRERDQAMLFQEEEHKSRVELHKNLKASEQKVMDLTTKLAGQRAREPRYRSELQELQTTLERSRVEQARLKKEASKASRVARENEKALFESSVKTTYDYTMGFDSCLMKENLGVGASSRLINSSGGMYQHPHIHVHHGGYDDLFLATTPSVSSNGDADELNKRNSSSSTSEEPYNFSSRQPSSRQPLDLDAEYEDFKHVR